jgi:uncharacterized protein YjbI with pentapeptide repeats
MSILPPNPPKLPDVLDQLKSVRSEAAELRNFTITFLSLLLYINIIIAGTDAEQILRIAPVTLPFLNVPLPIIGFYGFVPWLLLLFHLYLLVQHYLFSQQLFLFKNTLDDTSVTDDIRGHVRKNLGNLPFLHWMIGRHHFAMQSVLTLITLISLIIWPLVTLLWLQMAILPYHDNTLIWVQRASIILDVVMIGWLWPKTLANDDSSCAWWWRGVAGWWYVLVFLPRCLLWLICRIPWMQSTIVDWLWQKLHAPLPGTVTTVALRLGLVITLALSWVVATLPYAWGYALAVIALCLLWRLYSIPILWSGLVIPPASLWHTLKATLPKTINASILALALCATLFFSLLVATLPDSDEEQLLIGDVNSKPIETDKLPPWLKAVDVKQDEGSLEFITTRVAFTPTAWLHEQHAYIFENEEAYQEELAKGAKPCPSSKQTGKDKDTKKEAEKCLMVQPVLARNLILREKVLTDDPKLKPELEARLQTGVSDTAKAEILVQIRGLNLQNRNFDYADFTESSLPKADLRYASLKHAVLFKTRMDQVRWNAAHLDQANLSEAQLSGAALEEINLSAAILIGTNLSGAILKNANLSNATLFLADLSGALLNNANLSGARLNSAILYGTDLTSANLSDALLTNIYLIGATLYNTKIDDDAQSAYLSGALLLINTQHLSNDFQDYFLTEAKELTPCVRNSDADAKKLLPDCIAKDALDTDEKARKALIDIWLKLACDDKTEGHWVAQRMLERVYEFRWFAKPLLQATSDAKTCVGLAWLSEKDKAGLQQIVDEETKKPAQ